MMVAQISSSYMISDKSDHDDGADDVHWSKRDILLSVQVLTVSDGLLPGYIGKFAVMPSFYR